MKRDFIKYQQFPKYLLCTLVFLFLACDTSLNPIVEGPSIYSYYGILDIDQPINFVRINDVKTPSNSLEEENLNVLVTLTDLNTNETFNLIDKLIYFEEEFLTHNFTLSEPLNFDTDYVLILENEFGFRDSVFASTPRKATATVTNDNKKCDVPFFIEVSPYKESEIIEFEMEFLVDTTFFQSKLATSVTMGNESIIYEFTPNQIIKDAFGDSENTLICEQLASNDLLFRYTHIGTANNEQGPLVIDNLAIPNVGERNIIGLYSDELVFEIDTVPPPPFPPFGERDSN